MSESIHTSQDDYQKINIGPKSVLIPHSWDTSELGEISQDGENTFTDGDWVETSDMVEDGEYQLIQLGNIGQGHFKGECDKYVSEQFFEQKNCTLVEEGDLLISRLADPVLRTIIMPGFEKKSIAAVDIVIAKVNKEEWNKRYIWQLLNSKLLADAGGSLATGSTRKRISRSNMEKITIPRPPLPEQHRIAEILSTIDTNIRETEEIIKDSRKLKRSLWVDLLENGVSSSVKKQNIKIGPQKFQIPYHWNIRDISEIGKEGLDSIRAGPYGSKLTKDSLISEGIKVYRQENIYKRDFKLGERYVSEERFESELSSYEIKAGDVLVTITGNYGSAATVPEHAEKGIINQKLLRIRVDKSVCLPEYVGQFIDGSLMADFQIESISHGAVVEGINKTTLSSISIALPPIEEQRTILDILSTVQQKIKEELDILSNLQELKRGLMQDLLTGKVRVDDIDLDNLNQEATGTDE